VLRKRILKCLFGLPKSSFWEHKSASHRPIPLGDILRPQTKILEVRTNGWERIFEVLFKAVSIEKARARRVVMDPDWQLAS
jgi:hypothetical protein